MIVLKLNKRKLLFSNEIEKKFLPSFFFSRKKKNSKIKKTFLRLMNFLRKKAEKEKNKMSLWSKGYDKSLLSF
jgi:hypothetical protein